MTQLIRQKLNNTGCITRFLRLLCFQKRTPFYFYLFI